MTYTGKHSAWPEGLYFGWSVTGEPLHVIVIHGVGTFIHRPYDTGWISVTWTKIFSCKYVRVSDL